MASSEIEWLHNSFFLFVFSLKISGFWCNDNPHHFQLPTSEENINPETILAYHTSVNKQGILPLLEKSSYTLTSS